MFGLGKTASERALEAQQKRTQAKGYRRQARQAAGRGDPMKAIRLNSRAHDLEARAEDLEG